MTPKRRRSGATRYKLKEIEIMMADYNGWTDEREEEREALDHLDMTLTAALLEGRPAMPGDVGYASWRHAALCCVVLAGPPSGGYPGARSGLGLRPVLKQVLSWEERN
jgi:hypothetical protein